MLASEQYISLSISRLLVGNRVTHPVLDGNGSVLLAANGEITLEFLYQLKRLRIPRVFVHQQDRHDWGVASASGMKLRIPEEGDVRRLDIDYRKVVPASPALKDFARGMLDSSDAFAGSNRRKEARCAVAIPAYIIPVNERFDPVEETSEVVIRDISTSGAAIIHSRAVPTRLLILEIDSGNEQNVQILMEVLRCKLVRRFYEVGGRFLARL